MRRWLLTAVAACVILGAAAPVLAASPPVMVINNVLAESIVSGPKGVVKINKAIVGFKKGSADFQSLTQFLIQEPGMYSLRLEIIGPDGKLRATYDEPNLVEANAAGWTHSQLTRWRAVRFDQSGIYHFIVRVNNKLIADFPISATD